MAELYPLIVALVLIDVLYSASTTPSTATSTVTSTTIIADARNTPVPIPICPANQTAEKIFNGTTYDYVCQDRCEVNACHNGGTCVFLADNITACVCPPSDGGTVVYWGDRCEKETPQLALPLDAIIAVAAGGGGFLILILIAIIIALGCKLRRANNKMKTEKSIDENSITMQGSTATRGNGGQVNPGLSGDSMTRMSSYLYQPSFSTTNSKGEITFGYKDATRQHHFDRRSLDLDDPNKVTLPRLRSNDYSNGVARQPDARDGYSNRRSQTLDDGERRFVERNPDYYRGPDVRQNGHTQGNHLYPQTHDIMMYRPTQA